MSTPKGIESGNNELFKLVPISKEEADKLKCDNEIISYEYIKKLENENTLLSQKLNDKCKLIKDLNNDLKRMETERLLCMIFESYQRFRTQISEDLEKNGVLKNEMKFEAFLDAVKKGKQFTGERIIHWVANLDTSEGMQLLKDFRNDYSHYTNNDLSILRQWRTRLIEESDKDSLKKSTDCLINEAALNILNTVINHLSRPESRPLQRRRLTKKKKPATTTTAITTTKMMNKKVVKRSGSELALTMSKKQKKKLLKMMKRAESPSNSFVIDKMSVKEASSASVVPNLSREESCEMPLPISSSLSSASSFIDGSSKASDTSDISDMSDLPPLVHTSHKALFEAYHRNSELIGKLRKDGEMTPLKLAEIRRLRLENQRMVKEKGIGITLKAKAALNQANSATKKKTKKKKKGTTAVGTPATESK